MNFTGPFDKVQNFGEFALATWLGLFKAICTDTTVFLIACAGLLLGSRSSLIRSLGKALFFFLTLRRVDDLMSVYVGMKRQERPKGHYL